MLHCPFAWGYNHRFNSIAIIQISDFSLCIFESIIKSIAKQRLKFVISKAGNEYTKQKVLHNLADETLMDLETTFQDAHNPGGLQSS